MSIKNTYFSCYKRSGLGQHQSAYTAYCVTMIIPLSNGRIVESPWCCSVDILLLLMLCPKLLWILLPSVFSFGALLVYCCGPVRLRAKRPWSPRLTWFLLSASLVPFTSSVLFFFASFFLCLELQFVSLLLFTYLPIACFVTQIYFSHC